jgi:hypothetical protein
MDDYTRGLLAGLLIGEGSFLVMPRPPVRVSVGMHPRSERFLRDMCAATKFGTVYGPYQYGDRLKVVWHITLLDELADLCRLLDADDFDSRCDWVGWRYRRMREALRDRITWEFPSRG